MADNFWFPRASYLYDDELLGDHSYLGLAYLKAGRNNYQGPSIRYAKGELGEKFNLSYTAGVSVGGYDLGISYIKQNEDTVPAFNGKREGPALEINMRVTAGFFALTVTEESSYFTSGYGF